MIPPQDHFTTLPLIYFNRKFESQILSLFLASKMPKFDPSQLPDLTGFVVIVTGGHSGLSDLSLLYTKKLADVFQRTSYND